MALLVGDGPDAAETQDRNMPPRRLSLCDRQDCQAPRNQAAAKVVRGRQAAPIALDRSGSSNTKNSMPGKICERSSATSAALCALWLSVNRSLRGRCRLRISAASPLRADPVPPAAVAAGGCSLPLPPPLTLDNTSMMLPAPVYSTGRADAPPAGVTTSLGKRSRSRAQATPADGGAPAAPYDVY